MVDSDPEFARVVKGRIEKTTLGEVYTVYYTSVFYMCLFIWIKWKFMIKLTETMVYVIKIWEVLMYVNLEYDMLIF